MVISLKFVRFKGNLCLGYGKAPRVLRGLNGPGFMDNHHDLREMRIGSIPRALVAYIAALRSRAETREALCHYFASAFGSPRVPLVVPFDVPS